MNFRFLKTYGSGVLLGGDGTVKIGTISEVKNQSGTGHLEAYGDIMDWTWSKGVRTYSVEVIEESAAVNGHFFLDLKTSETQILKYLKFVFWNLMSLGEYVWLEVAQGAANVCLEKSYASICTESFGFDRKIFQFKILVHNFGDQKVSSESEIRMKFPSMLTPKLIQDSAQSSVTFTTEIQTVLDPLQKIVFTVSNPEVGKSNTYNSYFEF